MKKIRVLVVDDSAVVRQTLTTILSQVPDFEVMRAAADPYVAVDRMKELAPHVILLDVEMPRMDGITFLKELMSQHPIPVVMCSSLTQINSETTMKALEYGAVDIIEKPRISSKRFLEESSIRLIDAVRAAAQARVQRLSSATMVEKIEPKLSADAVIAKSVKPAMVRTTEKVVVVGASTGGTEALRTFLEALPVDSPGVVIVQHMPEKFTAAFAQRLDRLCKVSVKEAATGDSVLRGHVLIAPGNRHVVVNRDGARYIVEVRDGPLVNRHRPSVDVLFRSAAQCAGRNVVAVIMTGMGDDGAAGMVELKQAGAATIAQDEATSVVFGMPQEAIKRGAIDRVLALPLIAWEVLRLCE